MCWHQTNRRSTSYILCCQQEVKDSVERWEEHQRMLIILEQKSQESCQAIEQISERQELLAAQMERMKTLQKDAPEKFREQNFQEIKDPEEQRFKE